MDQLAIARTKKKTDNMDVSPEELLRLVLSDLESGHLKADGLIILAVNRPENEAWETESYRCGMSRTDEIGYLELSKDATIRRWRTNED